MSAQYSTNDVSFPSSSSGVPQVVAGVTAGTPISRVYRVTDRGAQYHVVKIVTSAATVVGSITAKLQSSIGGDWVDAKSVTIIAGAGIYYIRLNNQVAGDQAALPLLNDARVVVVNTNAGDSVSISSVSELQPR